MNHTAASTVEIDTDEFAVCEDCDRTFFEDDCHTDDSGTTCWDCHTTWQNAEMRRAMASFDARPVTREQLEEDQAGFLPGDKEYAKLAGLLAS